MKTLRTILNLTPGPRRGAVTTAAATAAIAALTLAACETGEAETEELRRSVIDGYASIVHASYEDAAFAARGMDEAIRALVAAPSEATLDAARAAWLAAREPYGQTEAYRFYGGPIDGEGGPETLVNAWPLDEGYVDYVEGAPESGIINDPARYPVIDRELLISLNESGAEENIATGFHAIEFLLWGQDLSDIGPGARPHTDYVTDAAPNADRRGRYLIVASELLVGHLETLVAEWAPNDPGNYRASLADADSHDVIRRILVGIGVLSKSELAGERMFTAYDNQDQEDEHSCFSDNTHRDIVQNARGIRNVLVGRYVRTDGRVVEGTGVVALIDAVDPDLAREVDSLADRSLAAVEAIPTPFDRAIVDAASRPAVLEAVYLLQDLGDRIAEAGTALGLTINTALPG